MMNKFLKSGTFVNTGFFLPLLIFLAAHQTFVPGHEGLVVEEQKCFYKTPVNDDCGQSPEDASYFEERDMPFQMPSKILA